MPHAGLELLEISSSSKDGRKFLTQRSERDLPRQGYRAVTARGIAVAGRIVVERADPVGVVLVAGGIAGESECSSSRVAGANGIAQKRSSASGRVFLCGIEQERSSANGRIKGADGVAQER